MIAENQGQIDAMKGGMRIREKPAKALVSTSYVEKHKQTMRKRFSRLTAAHSKKVDNHVAVAALYITLYNFARIDSAVRMSPAMACGLEQRLWGIGDIVRLIEQWETSEAA